MLDSKSPDALKRSIDSKIRTAKGDFMGPKSAASILALLTLSACGGGDSAAQSDSDDLAPGGDDGGSGGDQAEPTSFDYSGAVVKGPLQNALVFLDYDGDGVLGADEPSIRTNLDGSFELAGDVAGAGFVAQTDETTLDTSSGEILNNVTLKAAACSSVITPATTIMKESGLTKEQVSKVLGLPEGVDPTSHNPFAAGADPATALAVEKISQQTKIDIGL